MRMNLRIQRHLFFDGKQNIFRLYRDMYKNLCIIDGQWKNAPEMGKK